MSRRWVGPLLLLAMWAFALAVYPALPARIPMHWGFRGGVDRWGGKWPSAFVVPLAGVALWLLLPALRRLDPRRGHYERFEQTFWLLVNALVAFMAVVEVALLGAALGWAVDMTRVALVLVGLVFVVLGNYLPRVRSNWWVGIRTPWTLESERVWRETHRLGGRTFVIGGLVTMVAALLPAVVRPWVALAGLVVGGFVPVVYSYVVWRREQLEGRKNG